MVDYALDFKNSADLASTGPITPTGEQVIDGVMALKGDRVLRMHDGVDNGIWIVRLGAWKRATDFLSKNRVTSGAHVYVEKGVSNQKKWFTLTTVDPIVLGTTALVFEDLDDAGAGGVTSVNGDTGPAVTLTPTDIGLGNVDNTSDANKPVSTAQQAALNAKLDDSQLDTDGTFAANSDARIASQKAVKTFVTAATAGATATDIQVFTSSGSWNMPAGAKTVEVVIIDGGNGGGSGRRGAAATVRGGGSGGAGGVHSSYTFAASNITSPVTITVGAGGAGGAAQTVDNTNGLAGATGGASSFGTYLKNSALAVTNSLGGTTASTSGGQNNTSSLWESGAGTGGTGGGGGAGGAGRGGPGGVDSSFSGGGGGGGGGVSAANAHFAGGGSRTSEFTSNLLLATGGAAQANGTTPASYSTSWASAGGGGGGGSNSGVVAAGSGAAGGVAGGGGGGGGGSTNGANSGAGGAGAAGIVVVTTYF